MGLKSLKGKPWVNNRGFLLVTLLLIVKIAFFSIQVGTGVGYQMLISSAAILLILTAWFILLPYFARTYLLLVFDFIVSLGLLADLLYFRFFHSLISVPVLFEVSHVGGISSSIFVLFSKTDFLLFIDIPLLVPHLLKVNRESSETFTLKRRFRQFSAVFVICGLVFGFTAKNVTAKFSENAYIGLNWANTVLSNLGVVNFHLYDLYSFLQETSAKKSLASDSQQITAWMDNHRKRVTNNLRGMAKGKNLIVVQLEATQGFLIGSSVNGQEITPNLNRLITSSLYFDNLFTQIGQGNTSDAEFVNLNSLYPAATGSNYIMKSKNTYESLPWVLREVGYQGNYAFHANTPEFWNRSEMYTAEGFTKFYNTANFFKDNEQVGMGLSDQSMFQQVITELKQFKQPYFSFVITLSGHYPYNLPESKKELNIPEGQYSEMFTDYLQAQHYADKALGEFITELERQGILDNSVLVVEGDHYGTGWTNQDIEKFLDMKEPLTDYTAKELNKVPLLIHLPGGRGTGVNHIAAGQMDLYPTLLNLLGIDSDHLFYFGQDLLNVKEGFAAFRVWAPNGSFVTNDVFYIASEDGKFENGAAYDRKSGKQISLAGLEGDFARANWALSASDLIIKTNGLPQLVEIQHGNSE